MIRVFFAGLLLFVCGAQAAEQGQLDASLSVFSVMAAIHAAGYDADLESPANSPLRELIRKRLAATNIPVLPELKGFYRDHKLADSTADLSQYISFALSVDGPPNFTYRFRTQEIPPDVVPLDGFEKLLVRFYTEANIEELWKQSRPAIDEALARYHGPVIQAVQEVNGYLRYSTSGYLGRRFQIYLDLLGPPNQIQSRSYADDFFIVLTPSPEPQISDVRHAYLHYLLDPLATKFSKDLMKKQPLGDYALGAPALEDYYKNDFLLLSTESLIKAVEARLDRKPGAVDLALREGFVLAPHFYEQLLVYEKDERTMRLYFPDLVSSISFKKEEKRLENVQFDQHKPVRMAKVVPAERKVEPTGVFKTLDDAEQFYTAKDYEQAKLAYRRVLEESSDKPLHAKSYYGLARIAAIEKDPELAEKLFQKVLDSTPDPQTAAWTHVYLARLADLAGEREPAVRHYQAVLSNAGASPAARQAAQKGLQEAFQKK